MGFQSGGDENWSCRRETRPRDVPRISSCFHFSEPPGSSPPHHLIESDRTRWIRTGSPVRVPPRWPSRASPRASAPRARPSPSLALVSRDRKTTRAATRPRGASPPPPRPGSDLAPAHPAPDSRPHQEKAHGGHERRPQVRRGGACPSANAREVSRLPFSRAMTRRDCPVTKPFFSRTLLAPHADRRDRHRVLDIPRAFDAHTTRRLAAWACR